MKAYILSVLLGCSQQQANLKGGCPKVADGWDDAVIGKMKLNLVTGSWRNVYDHHNSENMYCMSIKLEQHNPTNQTEIKLYQGSFSDFPDYEHEDHGKRRMLYDDSVILTFNNQTDSSLAVMNAHEDDAEAQQKYLDKFDVPTLTRE